LLTTNTQFSKRFGFLDRGEDIKGIMQSLETTALQSTVCGIYLWLAPIIFGLIPSGLSAVVGFITAEVQGRLKSLEDSEKGDRDAKDFLTKLALLHRRDQEAYTYWHVFAGCAQNVAAGSETTSITLKSMFDHLMKDPQRLHKLQTEIDEAIQSGQVSDPITFAQAQKLPYLQAVIKEGLRMHPATGLPIWRTVPEGGATIAGIELPAGVCYDMFFSLRIFPPKPLLGHYLTYFSRMLTTRLQANVGINSWVAHHNKDVFGEDAALFRPERWLSSTSSPEQLAAMEKYYMPFGLGSRTCIGKNISLLEISKLVPHLIRHYEFRLLTPTWTCFNNWFCKQFNIDVTVSRRELL